MARKRFSRTLATWLLWLAFKLDKDYLDTFLKDPFKPEEPQPQPEEVNY